MVYARYGDDRPNPTAGFCDLARRTFPKGLREKVFMLKEGRKRAIALGLGAQVVGLCQREPTECEKQNEPNGWDPDVQELILAKHSALEQILTSMR